MVQAIGGNYMSIACFCLFCQAMAAQTAVLSTDSGSRGGDLNQIFGNMKIAQSFEERKVSSEVGPVSVPPPGIVDRRPPTIQSMPKPAPPAALPQSHVMHNSVKVSQQVWTLS